MCEMEALRDGIVFLFSSAIQESLGRVGSEQEAWLSIGR